ncbi:MAG TPA: YkvA family protein, partial [Nevskiaceae bacterium]|nr:YkvA family protein [Nevskiaceae bacterium]
MQTLVVYFPARDPRTPGLARVLALGIAAYALSPVDLIPDFIPVLGLLDDLVIVPLGLMLVLRLIPADVLVASQAKARRSVDRPVSRMAAAVIVVVWLL